MPMMRLKKPSKHEKSAADNALLRKCQNLVRRPVCHARSLPSTSFRAPRMNSIRANHSFVNLLKR